MISTIATPNSSMRYWVGSKWLPKILLEEIELAQDLGAADHDDRGDGDADLRCPCRRARRWRGSIADSMKVKVSGEMKPCRAAKNEPAKPPNIAPMREGRELGVGGVDAERAAGDLVLAQRFPGAADRQAAQPHGDEGA